MTEPSKSKQRLSKRAALTDDLIYEILLRLPARSIGRFRCVSKKWLSITTDPKFIQTHASLAPVSGFYIRTFTYGPLYLPCEVTALSHPYLSFLDLVDRGAPTVLSSCNGLLLCDCPDGLLSVCNPITKQHHVIPKPKYLNVCSLNLAFDPSISPDNFKVTAVFERRGNGRGKYHIYSLVTKSWKLLEDLNAKDLDPLQRSVYWNGYLVWLGSTGSALMYCLDVERECVKRLPLPGNKDCLYFGESRGRLYFIQQDEDGFGHHDIFEMKSESAGWHVLYSIIPDLGIDVNQFLYFLRGENKGEDRLLMSISGKIVSFHLPELTVATLCDCHVSNYLYWFIFNQHAHTLLFPIIPNKKLKKKLKQKLKREGKYPLVN